MPRILEEVFDEVGNIVVLPGFKAVRRRSVCRFPNDAELGHIGIFCIHKAVVEVVAAEVLRAACGVKVDAVSTEIDTVFHKVFDFPVSRFGILLVVITENRMRIVERRNAAPAVVTAVGPQRADVHADRVFFLTLRNGGLWNIVFAFPFAEYAEVV